MTKRKLGSVYQQPSGKWVARVSVGYKADGTQRTVSRTCDTQEQAESWIVARKTELSAAVDICAGVTLKTLWSVYETGKSVTKKTMGAYAWHMKKTWLPLFGDTDVTTITPRAVQKALDGLTHENAKHAKNALSSVLTFGVQRGILTRNPIRGHVFEYPRKVEDLGYDDDPFAAIERTRDVWSVEVALRCYDLIHGLPLESAWLCCVGAGLRVEEALALRRMDVRRVTVGGREITQIAVHAARTTTDARKETKTRQSVRVVGMLEPFGARLWEIVDALPDRSSPICNVSAQNQNKRWRGYFKPASTSKHAPRREDCNHRGRLAELPYLPLSKMRNTHVTIMAESGVSDSINALIHGHTEMVERRHYLSPNATNATLAVSDKLRLVV